MGEIRGDQATARTCAVLALKETKRKDSDFENQAKRDAKQQLQSNGVGQQNREFESIRDPTVEDVNIVPIDPDNQEVVRIGSLLEPNEKQSIKTKVVGAEREDGQEVKERQNIKKPKGQAIKKKERPKGSRA